jgi:hypothetical protein
MMDVAELLERKRTLIERRQEAEPEYFAEIDHELHEIDEALTRVESKETPPTASH